MTAKPRRIQRKRTKGWRMPPAAVYVGRPGAWGNALPDQSRVASALIVNYATELGKELLCLEHCKNGAPSHPLYLPGATRPRPWRGYARHAPKPTADVIRFPDTHRERTG